MKTTQMIHSPRTFKAGLSLILAAGLASMPVLIGADERNEANAAAATKKRTSSELAKSKTKSAAKGKNSSGDKGSERSKVRLTRIESEAIKIASKLTKSQKSQLLELLNDAEAVELTNIQGIGEVRGHAIEQARPIESIEDLPKVKGVGLKTLADIVSHGKAMANAEDNASSTKKTDSKRKADATNSKESSSSAKKKSN